MIDIIIDFRNPRNFYHNIGPVYHETINKFTKSKVTLFILQVIGDLINLNDTPKGTAEAIWICH